MSAARPSRSRLAIGLLAGLVAGAATGLGAAPAAAQQTFVIGMYGGSFETVMRQQIAPRFERENNVRFTYIAGNSTDTLARLRAQSARQEMDFAFMDDGVMFQSAQLGYCGQIDTNHDVYKDLYDLVRIPGDKAIGVGFVATGIVYNEQVFRQRGWAAPTSWRELADPKYRPLLGISNISGTYGLHTLVMAARINGGGENNIEPGFRFMQEVARGVRVFGTSPAKYAESFQSGEYVFGIWGSGRAVALTATGFPMRFVYPQEGAVALMVMACPVAKPNPSPLAQSFMRYVLSPEVQAIFAAGQGFGPANRRTQLSPEVAALVPFGPEQVGRMIAVDWNVINQQREAWQRRWNREIER